MQQFSAGDKVVFEGQEGVVLGYKDSKVRVNFGDGRKKVPEADLSLKVKEKKDKKEKKKKKSAEKEKEKEVKPAAAAVPAAAKKPPAPCVADSPSEQTPAVQQAIAKTILPPQVDSAALHLQYQREGLGIVNLRGHDLEGSWELHTPTELSSQLGKKCASIAPWFRRAVRAAADGSNPDFAAQAADSKNGNAYENAQEKVQGARNALASQPLDTPYTVADVLGNNDIAQLAPYYYNHAGQWRKCAVFKMEKNAQGQPRYPIWLLARGQVGWEPDVRVGVLLVERGDIHVKESRNMEVDMRKAEIGEVTRIAITLGNIFPNVPSLERALIYFPQCFVPPAAQDEAAAEGGVTKRFEVREEIPYAPLPQFGVNPAWAPGSFSVEKDQSLTFVKDTPTGGPLINAPSWPAPETACVECGKVIDPSVPGPTTGGVVHPSFIGRSDPTDKSKKQFMHSRCVFASNEKGLAEIEFVWQSQKHAGSVYAQNTFCFEAANQVLSKKSSPTTKFPVLMKRGVLPSLTADPKEDRWWVGEGGIIHAQVKGKRFEFLHFPSRKLVFLLSEGGKKIAPNVGFDEGKRPFGHVLRSTYAQEGSAEMHLLVTKALDQRSRHEQKVAAMKLRDEAEEAEAAEDADEEPVLPTKEAAARTKTILKTLGSAVVDVLDAHSFLLRKRHEVVYEADESEDVSSDVDAQIAEQEAQKKEANADGHGANEDEEAEEREGVTSSDWVDVDCGSEQTEWLKMLRPQAEDEGESEVSDEEALRDFEDAAKPRATVATSLYALRKPGDRSAFDVFPFLSLYRHLQTMEDAQVAALFESPKESLAVLNGGIDEAAELQKGGRLPGFETAFPELQRVERATEWAVLQLECGAGLSDAHFEQRYLPVPYKRMRGQKRGVCKALSRLTRDDHYCLLLLEALLMCRSVERRKFNLIATPLTIGSSHATAAEAAAELQEPLSPELQRMYLEESLWLETVKTSSGNTVPVDDEKALAQLAAQLMVPRGRLEVASQGNTRAVVRVKGVQELTRECAETPFVQTSRLPKGANCSGEANQVAQLLQLYQIGSAFANNFGTFKGHRGNWVGAVGPEVTLLNYVLRGVHTPTRLTAGSRIDRLVGNEGRWVYKEGDEHKDLETLLGELPDLKATTQGEVQVPSSRIHHFFSGPGDEDEESSEEGVDHARDEAETDCVSYTVREFVDITQITIEVKSGIHVGEATLPIYTKSPVQSFLYDAGIRDDTLVRAVSAACCVPNDAGVMSEHPPASELFFLLLSGVHDRDLTVATDYEQENAGTALYPWRFHMLFKRFGMTKKQAIDLWVIVNSKVDESTELTEQDKTEIETHWKDLVRFRHFRAWTRLNEMYTPDILAVYRKQYQASAEAREEELADYMFAEEEECLSHGVDIVPTSSLSETLRWVMNHDAVGRQAVQRALQRVRGQAGEQRYSWVEEEVVDDGTLGDGGKKESGDTGKRKVVGNLVDTQEEEFMTQSIATRLAKALRREVRKMMIHQAGPNGQTGEPADSDIETESSNWDDVSLPSQDSQNPDVCVDPEDVEDTRATLDPFSRNAMSQFDIARAGRTQLPGGFAKCRRCSVTLQNIYRYSDAFVERIAKVPFCSAFISGGARQNCDPRTAGMKGVALDLFDDAMQLANNWSRSIQKSGKDTTVTHQAKERFLNSIEKLWHCPEGCKDGRDGKGNDNASDSDSDSDSDACQSVSTSASSDEDAESEASEEFELRDAVRHDPHETERRRKARCARESEQCKSGLCMLWDLVAGVAEEVTIADKYMQNSTTFGYSPLASLCASPEESRVYDEDNVVAKRLRVIEGFLDKLSQFSPRPEKRSFPYEHALYLIREQPVATLFFRFLQRNSMLAPKPQLVERYEASWRDPYLSQSVMRSSGITGTGIVPFAVEAEPFHSVSYERSYGEAFERPQTCRSFTEALCIAKERSVSLFVYNATTEKVTLLRQAKETKAVATQPLCRGDVFCVVEEVRWGEVCDGAEGKKQEMGWMTYGEVQKSLLGDDAPAERWERAAPCRIDPCDNAFKTEEQFEEAHQGFGKAAWTEAEATRLYTPEGATESKHLRCSQASGAGVAWDDLPECRWFPTDGFATYNDYIQYRASPYAASDVQGRFLPYVNLSAVLGTTRAKHAWDAGEERRFDSDAGRARTQQEFFRDAAKGVDAEWFSLETVTPVPEAEDRDLALFKDAAADASGVGCGDGGLYVLEPTSELLAALGREAEEAESDEQFCLHANLSFNFPARIRRTVQDELRVANFVPKRGDFTESPYFVFTLQDGCRVAEVTAAVDGIMALEAFHAASAAAEPSAKRSRKESGVRASKYWTARAMTWSGVGDLETTKSTLRELRYGADMSRNLQKLFKDREAAFPEEVFALCHELRYTHVANSNLDGWGETVQRMLETLRSVGCFRLVSTVLKMLGVKSPKHAVGAAKAGIMTAKAFFEAFTRVLAEDWTKPLQPVTLAHVEELAAPAGWIVREPLYTSMHDVLALEGAQGVLDWAVRNMMRTHHPLSLELRTAALMVNVVRIVPTEVRVPGKVQAAQETSAEIREGRLDWEVVFFDDTKKFEEKTTSQMLDDAAEGASIYASMYQGHKVDSARVRRRYLDAGPVETKLISGHGEAVCPTTPHTTFRPLLFVTDAPIRVNSYRIRANADVQPVAWRVEAALLPYDEVCALQQQEAQSLVRPEELEEYDFAYVHRHTERWSRPIDEHDFIPPKEHLLGRFVEGDIVEHKAGQGSVWSGGIVLEVEGKGQPVVLDTVKGELSKPKVGDVRHAAMQPKGDEAAKWYGAVSQAPCEWSFKFTVPDVVPLVFSSEQAPPIKPAPPLVTGFPDVMEYHNASAAEGALSTVKLDYEHGLFAATRAGKEAQVVWDFGTFVKKESEDSDGTSFAFAVQRRGIPGNAGPADLEDFTAWMPDEVRGAELDIARCAFGRVAPRRVFLFEADEEDAESIAVLDGWQHIGAYNLAYTAGESGTSAVKGFKEEVHNGQPVWCTPDEMAWLFADGNGRWAVSTELGGVAHVRSDQRCDRLPGLCSFKYRAESGEYLDCDGLFFLHTDVKYEAYHLHEHLRRVGVDRHRMQELGFAPDNEADMRCELQSQLAQRASLETRVSDVWEGIRTNASRVHKALALFKGHQGKQVTAAKFALLQSLHLEAQRLVVRVRSMYEHDGLLELHEQEREEDDSIAEAALQVGLQEPELRDLAMEWAVKVRVADGSVYSSRRQEVLNNYFERFEARQPGQVADWRDAMEAPAFKHAAEKCLKEQQAALWGRDRFVPKLYALAREVLQEDVRFEAMHKGGATRTLFQPMSKKRRVLTAVVDLVEASLRRAAKGPKAWAAQAAKRTAQPQRELLGQLAGYFAEEGREGKGARAEALLASLGTTRLQPHRVLLNKFNLLVPQLLEACPYVELGASDEFDAFKQVNWDQVRAGTRLRSQKPRSFWHSLFLTRFSPGAIRWPFYFDLTRPFGDSVTSSAAVAHEADDLYTRHFKDGSIRVNDAQQAARWALRAYVGVLVAFAVSSSHLLHTRYHTGDATVGTSTTAG